MTLPLSKEQIEDVPLTAQQALARLRHQPGNLTKEQREFVALVIERLQSDLAATRNALEEERERCAKIADQVANYSHRETQSRFLHSSIKDEASIRETAARKIAEAIRTLPAPQVKG